MQTHLRQTGNNNNNNKKKKKKKKKKRCRIVFENNRQTLFGCRDQTVRSRGVVNFACLSGHSYLSPGERSVLVCVFATLLILIMKIVLLFNGAPISSGKM